MNVHNEKPTQNETTTVFSRAYEINAHTMGVVNAAIASGMVTAEKVPEMIREVHRAFAESYAGTSSIERSVDALASGTAMTAVTSDPEAAHEVSTITDEVSEEVVEMPVAAADAELQVEERAPLVSIFEDPYDAVEDEVVRCLMDGVGKKMLKRYLRAHYNLEWEDYLKAFNLPSDYPSVAPKYSASKSVEAKTLGLGSTVPKTPKALRAVEAAQTPRTTSERRRRQRDPQQSGRIAATHAKVA